MLSRPLESGSRVGVSATPGPVAPAVHYSISSVPPPPEPDDPFSYLIDTAIVPLPIPLVLREPAAWFVINHVSDYPLGSLLLEGPGLHLRLYDETGLNLLGEGVSHADLQGQTLNLPPRSDGAGTCYSSAAPRSRCRGRSCR